jgi:hypothetical protein
MERERERRQIDIENHIERCADRDSYTDIDREREAL